MKNEKGFTVVEIIIVVSIVAVLGAIIMPSLINARTQASDTAATTYGRNLITYLASADTNATTPVAQTNLRAITDCTDALLINEGADSEVPDIVSSCAFTYDSSTGQFQLEIVTEASGTTINYTY
ncbi:MAG: prepilin-type N-terminal cleavage/methylation domain-containing protein [Trueperaceae bacterium]|nr:prepilin-type N-terminal cleavage/methylation domain-containing protein [Trueperaceae bacterium]